MQRALKYKQKNGFRNISSILQGHETLHVPDWISPRKHYLWFSEKVKGRITEACCPITKMKPYFYEVKLLSLQTKWLVPRTDQQRKC